MKAWRRSPAYILYDGPNQPLASLAFPSFIHSLAQQSTDRLTAPIGSNEAGAGASKVFLDTFLFWNSVHRCAHSDKWASQAAGALWLYTRNIRRHEGSEYKRSVRSIGGVGIVVARCVSLLAARC